MTEVTDEMLNTAIDAAMRALEPPTVRSDDARVEVAREWMKQNSRYAHNAPDHAAAGLLAAIDAVAPLRAPPDGDGIEAALNAWHGQSRPFEDKWSDTAIEAMRDAIAAYNAATKRSVIELVWPPTDCKERDNSGRSVCEDGLCHYSNCAHWRSHGFYGDHIATQGPSVEFVGGFPLPDRYATSIADHDRTTDGHPMTQEDIQTALGTASADPPIRAVGGGGAGADTT